MKNFLALSILLSSFIMHAQPVPQLIKDINPGTANSYPSNMVEINDVIYFFADDGEHGYELWRSDATEAGTYMVKDIVEGPASHCTSVTGCGPEYIVMNNILYFRASDAIHGAEIWRSDGTEAGTYMVKDINPGIDDCSNSYFMDGQYFTVLDNVLYFAADGGSNNIELWRSNGTEAGTYMVKDFADTPDKRSIPRYLTSIGDAIYFMCLNNNDEPEIWKSDGTVVGSILLKQMWTRSYNYKGAFFEFNGYIYFAGDDDTGYEMELWRTDGTPSNTVLFKDLAVGDGSEPKDFHILNDKMIFSAIPVSGSVLFTSDGTVEGTIQLYDAYEDAFTVASSHLPAENKMYFQGYNDDDENGLWVTDGTDAGTSFLSAIESGEFAAYSATVVNANNIVYSGYDDDNGCTTLFQSDGTPEQTFQSIDCEQLSYAFELITYNGKVIVQGSSALYGSELWLFEPIFTTAIPTLEIKSHFIIYPNPAHSFLYINGNENAGDIIIIKDLMGQIVKSISFSPMIDISDLHTGIYFITMDNASQKFIKQ